MVGKVPRGRGDLTMNGLFDLACGLARASAFEITHGNRVATVDKSLCLSIDKDGIMRTTPTFTPNECSRYHAPVTFKSEQCPVCRAHRLCNRLENRLDRALETIGALESEMADLRDGTDRV